MKFFVIRGKYLILSIILFIGVISLSLVGSRIEGVFKVGNREVPIYCVDRADKKIALTFNCAWNDDDIDSILKTLEVYNVKCTFFVVGEWAQKYPDSLKLIASKGHEIANHSYSHKHLNKLNTEEITEEIEKCDILISELTGIKPTLFRGGYGEYNDKVINICDNTGRYYIQWSVDSIDYGDASENDIFKRVVDKTKSGDIILMHTGTKNTAKVLPKILSELSKSYCPTTVSDLIYKENYIIDSTGKQIKS